MKGGELNWGWKNRWRIKKIKRKKIVEINEEINNIIGKGEEKEILNVGEIGMIDRLEKEKKNVVIMRKEKINIRIFGKEVMNKEEGIVEVKVKILEVKKIEIGEIDKIIEKVMEMMIDRDWKEENEEEMWIRGSGIDILKGKMKKWGIVKRKVKIEDGIVVVDRREV